MKGQQARSCTPLRAVAFFFAIALGAGFYVLFTTVQRLQARLDSRFGAPPEVAPAALPYLPHSTAPQPASAPPPALAALLPAVPPASYQPAATSSTPQHGLRKFLTTAELDAFFSFKSSAQQMGFAQHRSGDLPEALLPLLHGVFRDYEATVGGEAAGGFVDAGANIGDVSAAVLALLTLQLRVQYEHFLGENALPGKPALVDTEHSGGSAKGVLPFALLLEPSPLTRRLLQRRAEAGQWHQRGVHARVLPYAASNASGTASFCYLRAGSENSGLSSGAEGVLKEQADKVCESIETVPLGALVDKEVGPSARVFLLKVDVEGAEALVLRGAEQLFRAKRVSFVVFENHAKWVRCALLRVRACRKRKQAL
jgi:FkbM family methyltransferase